MIDIGGTETRPKNTQMMNEVLKNQNVTRVMNQVCEETLMICCDM